MKPSQGSLTVTISDEEKAAQQVLIDKARDYYKDQLGDVTVSPTAVVMKDDGTPEMDEHNLPVFKDSIEWTTNNPQIFAIWNCCKAVLEGGITPPNEEAGVFGLMNKIAKMEKKHHKGKWEVSLPINYFTGMLHILNLVRAYSLASEDKKFEAAIAELAVDFARRLDAYRGIKDREATMDKPPLQIVNERNSVAKLENVKYF